MIVVLLSEKSFFAIFLSDIKVSSHHGFYKVAKI